ncbi:LPXTG cell wall anchor domain-containing protein [Leifsonia sp. SIMBA_070]|uniref:LPXTG cell wall anchor domain-containing protein n=1 Tax=Leifsonia sp. SIMBA_070 TaxID=3085810 RepID=UPI00397DD2EB
MCHPTPSPGSSLLRTGRARVTCTPGSQERSARSSAETATPTLVTVATGITAPGDGAADPTAPNPFLNAADDDFTSAPLPASGGTTATVFGNDTNNGAAFAAGDVTPTITDDGGLTGATIAADGTITIPAGASAGAHTLTYQLCRTASGQTAICDTATAQLRIRDLIAANNDDFTAVPVPAAGGPAGNVFSNDVLNGAPIDPSAVTTTITDDGGLAGVSLAADGTLTVPANVAAGDHQLTYQVCENSDPTNCSTAAVTFTVRAASVTPPPTGPTPGGSQAPTVSPSVAPVSSRLLADTGSNADWGLAAGAALALLALGGGALHLARRRKAA